MKIKYIIRGLLTGGLMACVGINADQPRKHKAMAPHVTVRISTSARKSTPSRPPLPIVRNVSQPSGPGHPHERAVSVWGGGLIAIPQTPETAQVTKLFEAPRPPHGVPLSHEFPRTAPFFNAKGELLNPDEASKAEDRGDKIYVGGN